LRGSKCIDSADNNKKTKPCTKKIILKAVQIKSTWG